MSKDPLQGILEQQQRIREMVESPGLRMIQDQSRRVRDMVDPPVLRRIREQNERYRGLVDPPVLRRMRDQQRRLETYMQSPFYRSLREDRESWDSLLSAPLVDQIADYQVDLAERVREATTSEVTVDSPEGLEEVWFGAPSWAVLLWEIEGLLKSVELITAAMTTSKVALDAPIPDVLLALIVMVIGAAELALWLAKGAPDD